MSAKKRGLGKGLSALLEDSETDITSKKSNGDDNVGAVTEIPVASIEANPFQPRTHFDKEALNELSASIKQHGIIQPIAVRKLGYDRYQLISGERRFKASQMAGLEMVPAYIRIADDQTMLEMALVENIQRENLDAIEVAISFQRLMDECKLTQEKLSERVGKKRATVTNYLRLLKLPAEIQLAIRDKELSMGHARALISIDDAKTQLRIFRKAVDEKLSVRQVEELVRGTGDKAKAGASSKGGKAVLSFEESKLQDDLRERFGKKAGISKDSNGKGKLVIPFNNEADLEKIIAFFDI